MFSKATLLSALATTPVAVMAESVFGVVAFSRHGDRTAKYFKGYHMTNLGEEQLFQAGNYYRQRYIETGAPSKIVNISADSVTNSQLWASAPDQLILYETAFQFMQGLYPPLGTLNSSLAAETLTNGTDSEAPLGGIQITLVSTEGITDPDTIWIKGDDDCPTYDDAYDAYKMSSEYNATLTSSADFYSQFVPLLGNIMGAANVSYSQAYDVFDLLNVGSIHNESVAENLTSAQLDQLRYYANEWEWSHAFNASNAHRSIGGQTLAGGFLRRMAAVVSSQGKLKFNLMAGSYDNMMAFAGLTNLTTASVDFEGLPNYASSYAFELFTEETTNRFPANPDQDLRVRFLFKNGTDAELTPFPLFGQQEESLSYGDFVGNLSARAIESVGDWCTTCNSEQAFCAGATQDGSSSSSSNSGSSSSSGSGLSNAAAGGIGAGVTLAVVALVGGLVWLLTRRKRAGTATQPSRTEQKTVASDSESGSGRV